MNVDRLLAHYERIADAPDAVPLLRRFILDLAVRGKLVAQDPNDEPASISLVEGKRRRPQREARSLDVPGRLVAPVASLLQFRYGKGKKVSERLDEGPVPVFGSNGLVGYCETPLTEAPSIIVGRKGSAGALNLCDGPSWTTDVAYFVEAPHYFDLRYLLIGLQMLNLGSLGKGVKPGLSRADVYDLPLSVPPLAEQHRIVAKVDELMALCDQLEVARTRREATRDRLAAASLARLDAPDTDPTVFRNHAGFALEHLTPLTTRRDQIKALRQTILNLAVRGKLVAQDPADKPASDLLGRLAKAKVEGRKGRDWSKSGNGNREDAFEAALGWQWTTIDETAHRVTVGYVGPMKDQYVEEGIPFLRSQNVRANSFRPDGLTFITPEFHQTIIKSALAPGDVVVVRSGNVGTACVIPAYLPVANCSDLVVIQKPECVVPEFLCFYLNSLASIHVEAGTVGVALTHFNTKSVANMPIPTPPLAEQHCIVAKVDDLLALCDWLEASLATGDNTRCRLLGALLTEALEPGESHASAQVERVVAHG